MRILALLISVLLSSTVLAQDHRLTSVRLDGEVLRLNVTEDLQAVRHFTLPHRPRLVIDLFGLEGSLAEMPAPPAGSPVLEVRTGEHPNYLRLVVDLREALEAYEVRQSSGMIELGLGRSKLPPSQTGVLIGASPVPDDPAAPPQQSAPVVATGVESFPGDETATSTAVQAPAATPSVARTAGPETKNLDDLTTEELLALIEEELKAAGLDQEQTAEELIEQVEAELEGNAGGSARSSAPPVREAPPTEERRVRRPPRRPQPPPASDGEERPPFRFIDQEPAKTPPAESGDPNS